MKENGLDWLLTQSGVSYSNAKIHYTKPNAIRGFIGTPKHILTAVEEYKQDLLHHLCIHADH